jgi:hypothetical protein
MTVAPLVPALAAAVAWPALRRMPGGLTTLPRQPVGVA